jgi:FSR family fosmidomycin resistance protein-like MFS transporter
MSATALAEGESRGTERRTLTVASGAHVLHDGYTDLLIVLLPLWQTEFGLTYAAVGLMRALYVGVLALCQVPAARLGAWFGARLVLGVGTMLAGAAFILAGVSDGLALLVAALVLGGLGASVQHPIASNLVAAS